MNYTHYLWDFNGTLFDDVTPGIKSINTLLERRSLPVIQDVETYRTVFGFPIIEYYRRLGFDFSRETYDDIAREWVIEYLENAKNSSLHDGIREAISCLDSRGVFQAVLSATERNMLTNQLENLGILPYFREVLGLDTIHAHSKVELACRWAAQNRPERVLLIGDTLHDAETAAAAGFDCVLVARGHQSRQKLLTAGVPVYGGIRELFSAAPQTRRDM